VQNVPISLVIRNYDAITPLVAGDVKAEGVDLRLDRETPMAQFTRDPSIQAGEMSFAQYLGRLAKGDDEFIGLPIFVTRGFRQRCFFVQRDSGLTSLDDLAGKRIGIDSWGATGHTWNRALLREAGIDITGIEWVIGPPENATAAPPAPADLPAHARPAPTGTSLVDLVLAGEIDALIMSQPPQGFYEVDSPLRRLLADFREVEAAYAARVGYWPPFHIIGLRASVAHEHPWIVRSLYNAFDAAQKLAATRRLTLADTSPWLLDDLEHVARTLGPDWQSHGVAPNRAAIATFCQEMFAQGIINVEIDPALVFATFEQAMTADEARR
jgi:4,5-dihydroxyphthalate decarboxylase